MAVRTNRLLPVMAKARMRTTSVMVTDKRLEGFIGK
jgi:hypothetical protein